MKATLVNKSTLILVDGVWKYTIKKRGSGKHDFELKKDRIDVDEDDELFAEDDEEAEEEE